MTTYSQGVSYLLSASSGMYLALMDGLSPPAVHGTLHHLLVIFLQEHFISVSEEGSEMAQGSPGLPGHCIRHGFYV